MFKSSQPRLRNETNSMNFMSASETLRVGENDESFNNYSILQVQISESVDGEEPSEEDSCQKYLRTISQFLI